MANHFFEYIKIQNFKSLRAVELADCSRINLFIGKPNVGKSNILEALSLFGMNTPDPTVRNIFQKMIRYEQPTGHT